MNPDTARVALTAWRTSIPEDRYGSDHHVRLLNRRHLSGARLAALEEKADGFGRTVATRIGPLVERYDDRGRLPELVRWDGAGRRIEEVRFDEAYHEAGRLVWASGLLSLAGEPGTSFEQATLAYLLSQEGEAGHACPAVCTAGLVRALRRAAVPEVAARFLPRLLDPDYDAGWRGAQFLTEVQGGSDVGANAATAVAAGDGTYRISGEKWFCSVADADVFLITARTEAGPPGTAGLGCFVVPRLVGHIPNGFSIRRLKEKLGTRAMASGEIDFDGAVAYPVGPLDRGFRTMVTAMLNTSRWLNAVGNVGIMRRAHLEASSYAVHREAFGRPIGEFPAVRLALARIKAEWLGNLHSTWYLTGLDEELDLAEAAERAPAAETAGLHRFLVNGNKLVASQAGTDATRAAVEILGGNGAIETFSPLPRLLRDCVVYEQWEGTHNVLAAQVRRDLAKLGTAGMVADAVLRLLKGATEGDREPVASRAVAAVEDLSDAVQRSLADPDFGAVHFRSQLTRMVRAFQVGLLLDAAAGAEPGLDRELAAAAGLLFRHHLDPGYRPEDDGGLLDRADALLGRD